MMTRYCTSLALLLCVLAVIFLAGCRQKVAAQPQQLFPSGTTSTSIDDPTLKEGELPPPEMSPAEPTPPPPPPPPPAKKPAATGKWSAPTKAEIDAARAAGTRRAVIATRYGKMEVELYGKEAPMTVANFVKLSKAKFYDGLTFHRVESAPDFSLIQGGCPLGNGTGDPGYAIDLEEGAIKLKHVKGALAMARAMDPNSAGSQIYICRVAIPQLDGQYAVFGRVVKGLEFADKIQIGDTITSITIK